MQSWLQKILLLLLFSVSLCAMSQNKDSLAKLEDIFADLSVNDAANNSVLHSNESAGQKIQRNILIRSSTSKKKCYAGEQILVTYQLLTALESTSNVVRYPVYEGCISKKIKSASQVAEFRREGNRNYRVLTILKMQLTPIVEGLRKLGAIQLENKVRYIDENGKPVEYSGPVSGGDLSLQVDALPVKSMPADFSGRVGKFSVLAFAESDSLPAGTTNTLQLEILGPGDPSSAKAPVIAWPQDVEVYDSQMTVEPVSDSFPTVSRVIYRIPFVVKQGGALTIPAIKFSYFNPGANNYEIAQTEPIQIYTLPAAEKQIPPPVPEVKNAPNNPWYLIAIGIGLTAALAFAVRKRKKRINDPEIMPLQQPVTVTPTKEDIDTGFKNEISKLFAIEGSTEFIQAFKDLLTGYLQAAMGTSVTLEEEIIRKLRVKDEGLANTVQDLYAECNVALYSAGPLPQATRQNMIDKLCGITGNVETNWT